MADIDLVIRIPEEQYNTIKSDLYNTFPAEMKKWGLGAIRNGTPIPDNATNGDVIKTMFEAKDIVENFMMQTITVTMSGARKTFGRDWWYAPYQKGGE